MVVMVLVCLASLASAANAIDAKSAQLPSGTSAQTALQLAAEPQGNPNVKVWVNTNSGVYHCPGTRWYGSTKSGEYMTQKQAQEKGYRPAYGKVCQ